MTLFNARVQGLSFPLVATVDVLGFRVMAQSLLPIDGAKTLVYGSADAGKHVATGRTWERAIVRVHVAERCTHHTHTHTQGTRTCKS